jgi:hypothetical protein
MEREMEKWLGKEQAGIPISLEVEEWEELLGVLVDDDF